MTPDLHSDGPRGLYCPGCGEPVDRAVAKSYPSPGGQYRKRYCRTIGCRGFEQGVETLEAVIGFEREVIDIAGLEPEDVREIRRWVRRLRKGL